MECPGHAQNEEADVSRRKNGLYGLYGRPFACKTCTFT